MRRPSTIGRPPTHRGLCLRCLKRIPLRLELLLLPVGAAKLSLRLDKVVRHAELLEPLRLGVVAGPLEELRLLAPQPVQGGRDFVLENCVDLVHLCRGGRMTRP